MTILRILVVGKMSKVDSTTRTVSDGKTMAFEAISLLTRRTRPSLLPSKARRERYSSVLGPTGTTKLMTTSSSAAVVHKAGSISGCRSAIANPLRTPAIRRA